MSTPVGPRPGQTQDPHSILDREWFRKQLVQAEQSGARVWVAVGGASGTIVGRVEMVNGLERCIIRTQHDGVRWFVPIGNIVTLGVG